MPRYASCKEARDSRTTVQLQERIEREDFQLIGLIADGIDQKDHLTLT
jgi:hypothetical protein